MSHPIPGHEYGEDVLPEDIEQDEMSPAEHWDNIVELTKTIELQVKDLQAALKDFNKSAL